MSSRSTDTATVALASLLLIAASATLASRSAIAAELPLLVKEDFEHGANRWQPTDPEAWKLIDGPHGKAYSLFKQSKYPPPYRSPVNFALLKDVVVSDFVFEVELRSTIKDYPHRDLVLVFGYQDPAHFYYVHFGKRTDDHANQVFIVNGAARTRISTETTAGTPWDDEWHKVKIMRDATDGDIEIFFDGSRRTVMEAIDTTFRTGQVGVGSFDDTGDFDNVILRGTVAKPVAR